MENPSTDVTERAAPRERVLFNDQTKEGAPGLARAVADADGESVSVAATKWTRGGDVLDERGRTVETFGQRRRVREAEAAFVVLPARRPAGLGVVLAGSGQAEDAPHLGGGLRAAVAHQGGMGERLQEIERDRKQRRGESRRAPALLGAFANHGLNYSESGRDGRGQIVARHYEGNPGLGKPIAKRLWSRPHFSRGVSTHG